MVGPGESDPEAAPPDPEGDTATREAPRPPFLTADPAVFPAGTDPVTTRLRWDVGDREGGAVVLEDEPPIVVATGRSGEREIPWIVPGRNYTFALADNGTTLRTVTVRREAFTPEGYVEALREPEAYEAAMRREAEAWGRTLSDPERAARIPADVEAAFALGVSRGRPMFFDVLAEQDVQPDRCLSIGCGEGRQERALLRRGIGAVFDGVDVADAALQVAEDHARELGMSARYWKADLNFVELEPECYDLILATTSLHHVLDLEHVIDQVAGALKPDGLLWVSDYIGEAQFQFTSTRLQIVNAILSTLPDELTWNEVNQCRVTEITRKSPGTLVSPFESIRSDEIVPLLMERFEVVHQYEYDTILSFVCPPGTRAAFNRTPENRQLFRVLFALDDALLKSQMLSPRGGQYLFRHR